MSEPNISINVRNLNKQVTVLDIQGEITAKVENVLMDAFSQASDQGVGTILLNFSGLEYMDSSGIGLLVIMLIRAKRQQQNILACGLTDHYRRIFELTRLNEVIGISSTEAEALANISMN